MERQGLNSVPIHDAHVHFFDYIEEFPGQPQQPDFVTQNENIQERLKHQFLSHDKANVEKLITLRNCFKYTERRHVDFCLDTKFGYNRPNTVDLASYLGLSQSNRQINQGNEHDRQTKWGLDAPQKQVQHHAHH